MYYKHLVTVFPSFVSIQIILQRNYESELLIVVRLICCVVLPTRPTGNKAASIGVLRDPHFSAICTCVKR